MGTQQYHNGMINYIPQIELYLHFFASHHNNFTPNERNFTRSSKKVRTMRTYGTI